jgi:hypothetical protein
LGLHHANAASHFERKFASRPTNNANCSNITLGQAIEAIGFANIKARKPELGDQCNVARIEFKDGKFIMSFADRVDNLSF